MADDLIERLKRWCQNTGYDGGINSPPMLAVARIEQLKADLAVAREALEKVSSYDYGSQAARIAETALSRMTKENGDG